MPAFDPIVALQRSKGAIRRNAMDQPTTCKECSSQNVETGWAIGYLPLRFKKGPRPRLFDPGRPLIAIACLDCGHVALRLQKLSAKDSTR
jgi:hypothetical protein